MTDSFQPLAHPLIFSQPQRTTDVDSWHEHMPLAFYTVSALRPRVLVELGTWKGDSYCAFCQAVQTLALPTSCYAIDTWEGDDHTGRYGSEVLQELRAYHDPQYGGFSRLVQQTFDESAAHFPDSSIDLLHIDGYHTYDAVKHDFATWLPKLSDQAVVLLHDTNVRENDFGVWRLWDELSAQYPSVAFAHGHGIGILAVGREVGSEFLAFMRQAREDPTVGMLFFALGCRVAAASSERRTHAALDASRANERELELTLDEARSANAVLATELDGARRSEAQLATELVELRRDEAQLATELDELRRDEAEQANAKQTLEAELASVRNSISWRLTVPLRSSKHAVMRARRRAITAASVRKNRRRRRVSEEGKSTTPSIPPPASAADLQVHPLISVITPVFNTDARWLLRAVESLRAQSYSRWELCICDDGSTSRGTRQALSELAGDPSIRIVRNESNRGISAASNRALELAEGELVAFLDHDDELTPEALLECVSVFNAKPDTDVVYTDEDKVDRRGWYSKPFHKPNWSPDLFHGVMYVGHLLVIRRSLVEEVGGFDSAYDGVQDYELMLRVSERTTRIEHVPRILYHWRKLPESVASSTDAKPGISALQAAAVNAHLSRCSIEADAQPHPKLPHRVVLHPKPRETWPSVDIVIPTKDSPQHIGRCLDSLSAQTTYPNFRVVVVDSGTTDPDAVRAIERSGASVVPFEEPFNFSRAINSGVRAGVGEFVVLLNNDTEVVTPDWLQMMVWLAEFPDVGAVGPLLLYPNRTVQHAGVVLGIRGTADHIMRGYPPDADGYAGSLACAREVSAVTGACLLVERSLFHDLGELDVHFATHYQDVDFCLKLRQKGLRNLFTPRSVLIHHESASRGSHYDHLDRALLLDRWGDTIARGDPYYSPWLSLDGSDYSVRTRAA